MKTKRFPPVSAELLSALEEKFPDRLPTAVPSESHMGMLVGEQNVVRYLRKQFEEQNKTILEGT